MASYLRNLLFPYLNKYLLWLPTKTIVLKDWLQKQSTPSLRTPTLCSLFIDAYWTTSLPLLKRSGPHRRADHHPHHLKAIFPVTRRRSMLYSPYQLTGRSYTFAGVACFTSL